MKPLTVTELVEHIGVMTGEQAGKLSDRIKDLFGLEAPVMVIPPRPYCWDRPKEEPLYFDVLLYEVGPNRLHVIKEIRDISLRYSGERFSKTTPLSVKEAVKLVDGTPTTLWRKIYVFDSQEIVTRLKDVGAKVGRKSCDLAGMSRCKCMVWIVNKFLGLVLIALIQEM